MKPFPVAKLLKLVRDLQDAVSNPGQIDDAPFDEETKKVTMKGISNLVRDCEDCHLPSASDQFKRIFLNVRDGLSSKKLNDFLPEAMNRIEDECQRRKVMVIAPDYEKYFSNAQFFDPTDENSAKVSLQFPSTAEDIAESGKCLACGRPTACVMHLNRIMESGLKALATALGSGPQNDWGKYLSKIDEELQLRIKSSGSRTTDEQFYAEAHLTCDSVRRAWRNPTMHVDKTYTEERAEEILIAVRSFMRHLATKLHD
jgi:hypothetical protein